MARYYITTPIYYATDAPHIGHAYCTIAADAAARYRRLLGDDVFLLTGTDEHGQKMERQAAALAETPQALADRTSPSYAALWRKLDIAYDGFIRTTEPRHRVAVVEMWERMVRRGDIYRGAYEGLYCVGCESFYLEKELVNGRCPDHGTVPESLQEEGYFFRLAAYAEPLLRHIGEHPEFIQPASRRNEVVSFLRGGLRDLSVSRATTRWGLKVPGDEAHVIYVWVDALTNYLSGIGWPGDDSRWPADVHLCGKDILRFHAVYWPAFLLSAGLPLPRQIWGHGWWLHGGGKISKSSGGAIRVEPLIERFGADGLRYFLLREVPFGLDGSYSRAAIVQRYNSDLANDLGNLAQRTLQMVQRYRAGRFPIAAPGPAFGELATAAIREYREHFGSLAFSKGIEAIWELVRAANRYVDERAPWALAKDPARAAELDQVLLDSGEMIRLVLTSLWPVMPAKCEAGRRALGLEAIPTAGELAWGDSLGGRALGRVEGLFPRVDEEEWLHEPPEKESRMHDDRAPTPEVPSGGPPPTAPPAAKPQPAGPSQITIDDVMKLDLKVARVRTAERVERSQKLLRLIVDIGGEDRQIVAGIAERYAPEAMVGKSIVIIANLKPAKLMGVESQGMLLAATGPDGGPILVTFAEDAPPGARVR